MARGTLGDASDAGMLGVPMRGDHAITLCQTAHHVDERADSLSEMDRTPTHDELTRNVVDLPDCWMSERFKYCAQRNRQRADLLHLSGRQRP